MEELRKEIYETQFWEYSPTADYNIKANEVLQSLEEISTNPLLMKYVKQCLGKNGIELDEMFYIFAQKDVRGMASGIIREVRDIIIRETFKSEKEAVEYVEKYRNKDGFLIENKTNFSISFHRYTIKSF